MCFKQIVSYFYPRPPRGGRHGVYLQNPSNAPVFLSTPSARRATSHPPWCRCSAVYFYPRPPRGGRLTVQVVCLREIEFLSTPSARRATVALLLKRPVTLISIHALREEGDRQRKNNAVQRKHFYPRPPRGGRHFQLCYICTMEDISIHALREEGDLPSRTIQSSALLFLSTPSARRATARQRRDCLRQ